MDQFELTRVLIEVSRFFNNELPLPKNAIQKAARPKRIQAWQTLVVVSILECSRSLLRQTVQTPWGEPYSDKEYEEFIKQCTEDLERQTPVALRFIRYIHVYLGQRGLLKPVQIIIEGESNG